MPRLRLLPVIGQERDEPFLCLPALLVGLVEPGPQIGNLILCIRNALLRINKPRPQLMQFGQGVIRACWGIC